MTENEVIDIVSRHTIKKFEVIEKYVESWSQKLANNKKCQKLVFIDCMCNSGEYLDTDGNKICGTAYRVFAILDSVAEQYPEKSIVIYFNDIDSSKVEYLRQLIFLKKRRQNLKVYFSTIDANVLLNQKYDSICNVLGTHCLLVYDPYKASIDWSAITPFLNSWSEVILNHMVYDSLRAVKEVKSTEAIVKYERTYLETIESLIKMGNTKEMYENLIKDIIYRLHKKDGFPFYVSSFPFFNSRNAIMYNLIHCTRNIQGFKLYKEVVWKAFNGQSSGKIKSSSNYEGNLFEAEDSFKTDVDEYCYTIDNVVDYIYHEYMGENNVPLDEIWKLLDSHPVFPSDGFKNIIKKLLKEKYMVAEHRGFLDFGWRK